jgi:hypothetical protein
MFGLALENHWHTQYGCNQLENPLNHMKRQQTGESKVSSQFPRPFFDQSPEAQREWNRNQSLNMLDEVGPHQATNIF